MKKEVRQTLNIVIAVSIVWAVIAGIAYSHGRKHREENDKLPISLIMDDGSTQVVLHSKKELNAVRISGPPPQQKILLQLNEFQQLITGNGNSIFDEDFKELVANLTEDGLRRRYFLEVNKDTSNERMLEIPELLSGRGTSMMIVRNW